MIIKLYIRIHLYYINIIPYIVTIYFINLLKKIIIHQAIINNKNSTVFLFI